MFLVFLYKLANFKQKKDISLVLFKLNGLPRAPDSYATTSVGKLLNDDAEKAFQAREMWSSECIVSSHRCRFAEDHNSLSL